MTERAGRVGGVLALLSAAALSGCASQPAGLQPFTPLDLNARLHTGAKQKVDNFLVLMDTSSSMDLTYQGDGFPGIDTASKFAVEKEFLRRMNQSLPELALSSGLRTFASGSCEPGRLTVLKAGMTPYSKQSFQDSVDGVKCLDGGSPMYAGLEAAADDLRPTTGKVAVIVLSDGQQQWEWRDPVASVETLKQRLGDRLCLHTVWVGNRSDAEGERLMRHLPNAAGSCGSFSYVGDVVSSRGMADFVEKVFLETPLDSDGDGVPDGEDKCPGTPRGAKVDRHGCWVLPDVLFDIDQSVIKPEGHQILNDAVKVFERNPGVRVEIDGHADSTASDAHNMALSRRRANAVREYFVEHGVAANRLKTRGFGERMPVASNATEEGRALNRRVELNVLK